MRLSDVRNVRIYTASQKASGGSPPSQIARGGFPTVAEYFRALSGGRSKSLPYLHFNVIKKPQNAT